MNSFLISTKKLFKSLSKELKQSVKLLNKNYPLLFILIFYFILVRFLLLNNFRFIFLIILLFIGLLFIYKDEHKLYFYLTLFIAVYIMLYISISKQRQFKLLEEVSNVFFEKQKLILLIQKLELNKVEDKAKIIAKVYQGPGKGLKVYIYSSYEDFKDFAVGDVFSAYLRADPLSEASVMNSFNEAKWLASQGIYLRLFINQENYIEKVKRLNGLYFILRKIYALRALISQKLFKYLNPQAGALIATMLYGDKSYLSKDLEESFRNLGLSHVLVASGNNVSLALELTNQLSKRYIKSNKLRLKLNVLVLLFLSVLSLFDIAITRASLMKIVELMYEDRLVQSKKINYLLVSILIMAIINPYNLLSLSLILSFLSCLAVYSFSEKQRGKRENKFLNNLKLYFYIQLFIFPVLWQPGYKISLLKVLANVIYLPLTEFILIWSFLLIFTLPLPLLANFFSKALDALVFFLLKIFTLSMESFKLSFTFKRSYFLLFIFLPWRRILFNSKKKDLKRLKQSLLVKTFTFSLAFLLYFLISFKLFRVYFIDVGQGDASLISNKNTNILIDTGSKYGVKNVLSLLNYLEIESLDYCLLTHLDADHVGGFETLLSEDIKIKNIIVNRFISSEVEKQEEFARVISDLSEDTNIYYLGAGDSLKINDLNFYFFNPSFAHRENNDQSLAFLMQYKDYLDSRIFFTGDISTKVEREIISKFESINTKVLHIAHHGSKSSTSKEFLDWTQAEQAVISVGFKNTYKHPSKEVLERLAQLKVYRTDLDKTLIYDFSLMPFKTSQFKLKSYTDIRYLPQLYANIRLLVKEQLN